MKKMAFVVSHMLCGGVEKALLALIREISSPENQVTVFLVKAEGETVGLIPKENYGGELPLRPDVRDDLMLGGIRASVKSQLKHGHFAKLFKVARGIIKRDPLATLTIPFETIDALPGEYDTAVCFHIHEPFLVRYVAEKINAKKKVAWIHNDFANSGYHVERIFPWLDRYDHIFAVSQQLSEEFARLAPQYRDKTTVAHNIVSAEVIRGMLDGKKVAEYPQDGTIKLLTVGRLEAQKGYDLAIKVCAALKDKGVRFKWFVLGSGSEEPALRRLISDYGLEAHFILLGTRLNPYPYIDQCDIYVQSSRHEGRSVAIDEACVLYKPIVSTNVAGIHEQLKHQITGSIVRFDSEELTGAVSELIENPQLRQVYSENLKRDSVENRDELNEVLRILGVEIPAYAVI